MTFSDAQFLEALKLVRDRGGVIKIMHHKVGEVSETTIEVDINPPRVEITSDPKFFLGNWPIKKSPCHGCNEDDRGFVVVKGCPVHDKDKPARDPNQMF